MPYFHIPAYKKQAFNMFQKQAGVSAPYYLAKPAR
jgi:hypothetical protein